MGFNFAGGMAAATGYMKGMDDAVERDNAAEDRKYTREQRTYKAGQQARVQQEQQRADTLRSDLGAIQDTTTTDLAANAPKVDDDGNAMPTAVKTDKVLPDAQMRQAAAAHRKAGDFGKAVELHKQADAIAWDRSAKSFQELQSAAAASTMTAADVARHAAEIYSKDPFAGKVTNIQEDGNGGVTLSVQSREDGRVATKTYPNKAALLEAFHGYYSPQTYATLAAKRQEALIKASEKLAEKPVTTVPGGYVDNRTGKFQPTMVGSDTGMTDADGNPIYSNRGAPGAGGGRGAGAGAAGKIDKSEPLQQARALLKSAATESADKITDDQRLIAESHIEQIFQAAPGVTPAVAARVSLSVAKNPKLMTPTVNAATGEIDGVFRDKAIAGGKPFALAPNWMTPEEAQKASPDDKTFMSKAVAEMIAKQGVGLTKAVTEENGVVKRVAFTPQEVQQVQAAYIKAARDPEARVALEAAALAAAGEAGVASLNRKLELISKFGPAPAEQPGAKGEKRFQIGGLMSAVERRRAIDAKLTKDAEDKRATAEAAPAKAKQLLAAGNIPALARFQASPEFDLLDKPTKLEIYNRVNSISK